MATKTDRAPLVECYVAHTAYDEETGHTSVIHAGSKWRADSPPVRLNGQFFHDVDLAEDERPRWSRFVRPGVTSGRQFTTKVRLRITQTTRVGGS